MSGAFPRRSIYRQRGDNKINDYLKVIFRSNEPRCLDRSTRSQETRVVIEQILMIGPDETFGRAVLRIDKDNILRIAARRVDGKEDNWLFQDLRLRMYCSAFEKE